MTIAKFRISSNGMHRGAKLLATTPFAKGDVVDHFTDAQVLAMPTYQTIQISQYEHVLVQDSLAKLNHSCRPTTVVDTRCRIVIAQRNIAIGEELTFFYPSTEWEMAESFSCHCGFPECVGRVQGAKYLSEEQLAQHFLNPHIVALLKHSTGSFRVRTI